MKKNQHAHIASIRQNITKDKMSGLTPTWLLVLMSLVGQSVVVVRVEPWRWSQRVLLALWLPCCLILTSAYTSNLVAILTSPTFPQRLHTLHQFAHCSYRMNTVDYGGTLQAALARSTNPVIQTLWAKHDFANEDEAVNALMRGTHGYLEAVSYLYIRLGLHHKVFNWYLLKERLYPFYYSWYFPKQTPWKINFDWGLRRLQQAGLIQYWAEAEMARSVRSEQEQEQGQQQGREEDGAFLPLALHHLQGPFLFLVLSCLVALSLFLLELLVHSC